jgi:hypothetical protein
MGIALLSRRTTATFRQVGWAALSAFALGCGASAVGARDVPDASVLDAVDAAPRVTGDAARDSVAPSSDGSGAMNPHKPVQRGLIDMGVLGLDGRPASSPDDVKNYPGSFAGIVLNVTWAQLQPNGPDPLVDGDPLDVELDAVRAYDKANPKTPLSVKLRVAASFDAPAWAQRLSSGPVTIPPDPSDAKWRSGPVGEWWTPAYQAAWRDFQGLLAAKYDDDPLVYEVAVTSCSFQTDEPFIIPTGVALPVLHGIAAPYTYNDTAEKACLTSAREDYSAWKNTWVDFTFAYFAETDNGYVEDPAFTTATMIQDDGREARHPTVGVHRGADADRDVLLSEVPSVHRDRGQA